MKLYDVISMNTSTSKSKGQKLLDEVGYGTVNYHVWGVILGEAKAEPQCVATYWHMAYQHWTW